MKNFYLSVFIILFNSICFGQSLNEISKLHDDSQNKYKYSLIVISNSDCGYCLITLEKIQQFKNKSNIIIIDFGPKDQLKILEKKYSSYKFLEGNNIKNFDYPDFYPKLFLLKNHKIIWKKEGWFDKNLKKINSRIKN